MYRPWTNRYVGIEMEINESSTTLGRVSKQAIANKIVSRGVTNTQVIAAYRASSGRTWDVKNDGSCGYEIASPKIMFDEDGHNQELKSVCEVLRTDMRMRIDRRCGLHVHIDCSDFTWRDMQKLIALWMRYEPFFYSLLPASRRTNGYCRAHRGVNWQGLSPMLPAHIEQVLSASNESSMQMRMASGNSFAERRTGLNLTHFWRTKRIEFRLHSGTADYNKIRCWTILLLALVGRVKAENAPPLATKINQPKPEIGFRIEHVCRMLGLGATTWTEESEVARDVVRFAIARHAQHSEAR